MRTVQLEHMRPEEIVEQQKKKSIAYLPLGPLEWHTLAVIARVRKSNLRD